MLDNTASWTFDSTISLTTIVALSAIIAPVFVALINNYFTYRTKKLEFLSNKKFHAIESFLQSAGAVISTPSTSNRREFQKHKSMIYLYIPKHTWKYVDLFDEEISKRDYDAAQKTLTVLSKHLSNWL